MRRVCLAIGVSRAENLSPLRAAATAAEEVGEWALRSKFAPKENICVLTDRKDPVTVDSIKAAISALLPAGTATDAFLLHFAGHGLREDNTRTLWLPTNWQTELRAIAVERLKNRLSDFGIANLTIVSDACKALANDKDTSDLTADGVLGAGTSQGVRPILDRYDAVHDVESAFMIPGPTPEESRCIFSGALIEALWGRRDEAFDPHIVDSVTPGSLHDFLKLRVEELCTTYGLKCEPQMVPGRPPDHLIYFRRNSVAPADVPPLRAWPAPVQSAVPQGPAGLAASEPLPKNGAAPDTDFLGEKIGSSNPDISAFDRALSLPRSVRKSITDWKAALAEASLELEDTELDWLKAKARGEVEQAFVEEKQTGREKSVRKAFSLDGVTVPLDANLVLRGEMPRAIWSARQLKSLNDNQWRADIGQGMSEQLMVEYADGVYVPVVVYREMITIATRDQRGTTGWMFVSKYGTRKPSSTSIDILTRMQAGNLPANEVDKTVAYLRGDKHHNPTIGAICAYLYDYIGDLDSIRRMAYFYVEHGQAIPYDIALMGELHAHRGASGYKAQVDAVQARLEIDTSLPDYVTRATDARTGMVGGLCPWLRQGWDFVEAPTDREAPLVQDLPDVSKHLLAETFTSFDETGGKILIEHWTMKGKKP